MLKFATADHEWISVYGDIEQVVVRRLQGKFHGTAGSHRCSASRAARATSSQEKTIIPSGAAKSRKWKEKSGAEPERPAKR